MFGNHGLCGLPEEGAHEKSPKCLGGNLGDFGEFCKDLDISKINLKNNKGRLDAFQTTFCSLYLSLSDGVAVFQNIQNVFQIGGIELAGSGGGSCRAECDGGAED